MGHMDPAIGIEKRLAIEHGAGHILAESDSVAEAAPKLLATICRALGWDCGGWWKFDLESGAMQRVGTWSDGRPQLEEFLEASRKSLPAPQAGGLIRRTWPSGEATWTSDLTMEKSFRRGPHALKAGLYSAFTVPIKEGALVSGVLEFFSREIRQPDADLLDCMRYVGGQVGQFCRRTEAQ